MPHAHQTRPGPGVHCAITLTVQRTLPIEYLSHFSIIETTKAGSTASYDSLSVSRREQGDERKLQSFLVILCGQIRIHHVCKHDSSYPIHTRVSRSDRRTNLKLKVANTKTSDKSTSIIFYFKASRKCLCLPAYSSP